jgi:transcriptional regulator with XRE-family HTH domain
MNERIREFLLAENKSSAQLAEEIGVQPSSISHILAGRNNPSLDFVLKMLDKFKFLSTDWLLFGKGSMYKDGKMQTLFEENVYLDSNNEAIASEIKPENSEIDFHKVKNNEKSIIPSKSDNKITPNVKKIVWFYNNNTFEEFFPG